MQERKLKKMFFSPKYFEQHVDLVKRKKLFSVYFVMCIFPYAICHLVHVSQRASVWFSLYLSLCDLS